MGWIRISDDFYDNDKFADVGALGMALWIAGLGYCNRNLTDGFIPKSRARGLVDFSHIGIEVAGNDMCGVMEDDANGWAIDMLLTCDLWHEDGHDCPDCPDPGRRRYVVHDYLEYQPSKAEVEKKKADNAKRLADWREGKKGAKQGTNAATNDASNAVTNAVRTSAPKPKPNPKSLSPSGDKEAAVTSGGNVTCDEATTAPPPPGNQDPNNPRCPKHGLIPADEMGPNCRACKNHRVWLENAPARLFAEQSNVVQDHRMAIRACQDCDENGMREVDGAVARCNHGQELSA